MIVGVRVVAPSTWTSGLVGTLFGDWAYKIAIGAQLQERLGQV